MFSMYQITEYAVQAGVEVVISLGRSVRVAVAQSFTHEIPMVQNIVGHQRFHVSDVFLFHRTRGAGFNDARVGNQISAIVEDETS